MKLSFTIRVLLLISLLLLLGILLTSWWVETRVLFNPSRDIIWVPSHSDYDYDNVFIHSGEGSTGDDRINLWHFRFDHNNPVILFCHGNSGNISNRGYIVDFCKQYRLNLVLFDYRGYGLSSGRPSIQSILDDGITTYQYVSQHYPPDDIIVWGESLGGSVATYIASRCKCRSLLLMSTFSSLDDIVKYDPDLPWWLSGPLSVLTRNILGNLPSKDYIKDVRCPVVIIHSPNDDIIPYRCGQILYQSIPGNNKLFLDIDGLHSSPIISYRVLCELFRYCNINVDDKLRDYTEIWLNNLQKISKIHMLK